MAKLIGTAGHVDHGKTTLIHALTGIDADRLPEEKRRGMTIDIGFAYIDFPSMGRVSVVDVPGHEKFIHNMLTGALGVDVALLCVAADEGVKPQTREHLQILNLLPVERMVVALTRTDLASPEQLAFAREQVQEELKGTKFERSTILPVSSVTGKGLDKLRSALETVLLDGEIPRPSDIETSRRSGPELPRPRAPVAQRPSDLNSQKPINLSWYLPIDRVFSVKGHGCVVTGTLAGGVVHVGDQAAVEPGQLQTRIRSLQTHGKDEQTGEPGQRTALNVSGLKVEEVLRGQVIGAPGVVFPTTIFDVGMNWLSVPKHAERVRVSIGADEVIGKVFLSKVDTGEAQLRLERETACALGEPLIVRRYSPPELLGGGIVTVPQAKRSRKSGEGRKQTLEGEDSAANPSPVISHSTPGEPSLHTNPILQILSQHQLGVSTEEVCRLLGKTPQALGSDFEWLAREGHALGMAGLWFSKSNWGLASAQFVQALDEAHQANPMKAYVPRESVVAKAGFKWSGKPLDRIVAALAAEGKIIANGTMIKSASFRVQLNPKQESLLRRVVEELDKGGVNVPSPPDLARELKVPPQAIDEILRLGLEAGELVRVFDGIFYSAEKLNELAQDVRARFGGQQFAAADFRDAFRTSRRYAIPLLEHFDKVGLTLRIGEKRVVR